MDLPSPSEVTEVQCGEDNVPVSGVQLASQSEKALGETSCFTGTPIGPEVRVEGVEPCPTQFIEPASLSTSISSDTAINTGPCRRLQSGKERGGEEPSRSSSFQVWTGVPHSCLARNRTNVLGRSLSETAINCRHEETAALGNCRIALDCGHGESRSPGSAVSHGVNEVFVNMLPPLDQPPSYDIVCKNYKLATDTQGTLIHTNASRDSSLSRNGLSTQLPTYREATGDGRYLEDAPPTYHSLFTASMLRAMQPFTGNEGSSSESQNGGNTSLGRKIKIFACRFVLITVVIGFILVMPLGMIVVGVANIHSCPVQPRIPIYLIVLGIFQMLECCVRLGYNICRAHVAVDVRRERFKNKDPLVYFMVVWFVVGSMWVYQTPRPCFSCIPGQAPPVSNSTHTQNNTDLQTRVLLESLLNNTASTAVVATQPAVIKPTAPIAVERYCDATVYSLAFWIVTAYYSTVGMICVVVILDAVMRIFRGCCCMRNR